MQSSLASETMQDRPIRNIFLKSASFVAGYLLHVDLQEVTSDLIIVQKCKQSDRWAWHRLSEVNTRTVVLL